MQCDSEIREQLMKLDEQQEALIASVASVKELLCANEKRRRCLFILNRICGTVKTLKSSFPYFDKDLSEILESLVAHANFSFESTEDLHALFCCLDIVASKLEQGAKDATSVTEFRPFLELPYRALEELRILDDGIPPGWKRLIDPDDKTKTEARIAARERIKEMSIASIDEYYKRMKEKREKDLY
jgi:hypothetical protein